ncbi:MAG: PAS domain S-box protein [Rhodothermales bacterium]
MLRRARVLVSALVRAVLGGRSLSSTSPALPPLSARKELLEVRSPTDEPQAGNARWFIVLRWIAVLVATALIVVTVRGLKLLPEAVWLPLIGTVTGLAALNLVYMVLLRLEKGIAFMTVFQAYADLVLLTILIHFSGGIENPLILLMIFHVIIAGIMLSRRQCFMVAVTATTLFALLAWAEATGLLEHYTLRLVPHYEEQGGTAHAAHDPLYAAVFVGLQGIILLLTAFFVTSLSEQRKRMSNALWEQAQIIDQVHDTVIVTDLDGAVTFWNKGAETMYGYTQDEVLGRHLSFVYPEAQHAFLEDEIIQSLLEQGAHNVEVWGRRKSGEAFYTHQSFSLRRNRGGANTGMIVYGLDVTRRKEAEDAARRLETFYHEILDELPLQVAIFDLDERFIYVNPAGLSSLEARQWIIGKTEEAYLEKTGRDPSIARNRQIHRRRAVAERTTVSFEEVFPTQVGTQRIFFHGFCPMMGPEGEISKVLGYRFDITEHKRAEKALQRYNERLKALRQIDQVILAALSPEDVAQVALRHLLQMIPARQAHVTLFDFDANQARMLTAYRDGTAPTEASYPLHQFRILLELLRSDVNNTTSGNGEEPGQRAQEPDALEYSELTYLDVPLLVQGTLIGALSLVTDGSIEFDEEEGDIARDVAGPLAIAIQNAQLFEQVGASRERLRALSRRLVEVQEAERRTMARELHDEIGQALTGLKLALDTCDYLAEDPVQEPLREAQAIVLQLLGRVRELSLDLRPAMLDDLGLVPALLWLIDRYTRQTGIQVDFKHSDLQRLYPDVETAAYRIVQEALTNVARHAGVSEVTVWLIATSGLLIVKVKDQGAGFNQQEVMKQGTSSGLSGMQERVGLLNGLLTIETSPGQGTTLTAELPLTALPGEIQPEIV